MNKFYAVCSGKARGFLAGLVLPLLLLFFSAANGQNGYIYVHKKTLDESSSLDFSFNVSGGPTSVPGFSLNDKPDQTPLADIGSSENGRLWAAGQNGRLYFRNAGSTKWVEPTPGITDAWKVDGGPGGTAYYINSNGEVYFHDGVSSETLISDAASMYAWDIGSGWDNRPYVTDISGDIYKYSGSGTVWNLFYHNPADGMGDIDVDPATGTIYADTYYGSTGAYAISPAGVATFMSKPAEVPGGGYFSDIGVDAFGNVFCVAYSSIGNGEHVFKWAGGTSWGSREVTTAWSDRITGGLGGQMWIIMSLASSSGSPYYNIFSRALDGATNWWIDDERVRTTVSNGNSEMIAVAPGTYTITENVPGGWNLQKITVYDPSSNSTSNVNAHTAIVTVAADEVVHVVFQNGLVNPYAMTNDCGDLYIENFGTGATGSFGPAFLGQTSYHYIGNSSGAADGYYKIVSQAFPDFNNWQSITFYDHTSNDGTGRMLAVNAAYDKNEFFRRRFTGIIPGAAYNFSAWIANLTPGAPIKPNVSFQVVDPATNTVIASNNTGNLTGSTTTWAQYTLNFVATSNVLELMLVNNNIGGSGNDLAIDDITFQLMPPPPPVTAVNNSCAGNSSITISYPLGAIYEYSIDGTNYQASTSFTNLTAGAYTVSVRYTGTTGCVSSKKDTVNLSICGNVFNDTDGMLNGKVDGTGIGSAGTTPLYISLYKGVTLIQTIPVNTSGAYQFTNIPYNTTYTAVLGTNAATNASSPFAGTGTGGWFSTGEICCNNTAGNDGATNGILTIPAGTTPSINNNFGIQQLFALLPVTLQNFTAQREANGTTILLQWTTTSESNNKGFNIERSTDGINWNTIGTEASKAANGNSTGTISYFFSDANPLPGINYYRLKQTDINGKYQYSGARLVKLDMAGSVTVFPNPTHNNVTINGLKAGQLIQLHSVSGQLLIEKKAAGAQENIDLSGLATGVYHITVSNHATQLMSGKVIKLD